MHMLSWVPTSLPVLALEIDAEPLLYERLPGTTSSTRVPVIYTISLLRSPKRSAQPDQTKTSVPF
jgi:hypothetical protein